MGHDHDHGTTATGRHRGRLVAVVAITAVVFVVEVVGALVSGSLALLADAGHVLTDSIGLVVALVASSLAARPATKRRTFGLQRAEILAALANAVMLTAIAVSVLIGAIQRWGRPSEVEADVMLWVAVAGIVANLAGALILAGGRDASLNLRGAFLEVVSDLVSSVAVVVAALVIRFTGLVWVDSLAAVAIFVLIVPRVLSLLRDAVDVLLEATPKGIDLDEVRQHLCEVDGVLGVHDVHAWTITSGSPVFSAHIVVADDHFTNGRSEAILDDLSDCLGAHFDLKHCTLQLEPAAHGAHEDDLHS